MPTANNPDASKKTAKNHIYSTSHDHYYYI